LVHASPRVDFVHHQATNPALALIYCHNDLLHFSPMPAICFACWLELCRTYQRIVLIKYHQQVFVAMEYGIAHTVPVLGNFNDIHGPHKSNARPGLHGIG
jgi:hypothetical protein